MPLKDTPFKSREQLVATNERARIVLDATPMACFLWDRNFKIFDCSEEAVKLFELNSKRECLDLFFELSPEFQPDGQMSVAKAQNVIGRAFREGRLIFDWMHQTLNGEPIPSEITLIRVEYKDDYIVAGYARDLREYKKMMEMIEYKDTLLHTVNSAATVLLRSEADEFENDLWDCMGMMAKAADSDRVGIWKNHVIDGKLYCTQLYEWAGGVEPQRGRKNTVNVSFSENLPGWEEKLSTGQCINGLIRNMSATEQAQLSPQGIRSILVVPVLLQDTFWGFVGFDDCRYERLFSEDEEAILRSGSLLFANALLRNETTKTIRAASAKMEAVIKNYTGIIWSVDKNNDITLFDGLYLKELGVVSESFVGKNLDVARRKKRHLDIIAGIKKTFHEGPQNWLSDIDGKMYRLHTTPIRDENGSMTGVVGSVDDITEIVRLQNELKAALKDAQAASRAKSDFLANMSHEIRTPMNAVLGMLQLAQGDDLPPLSPVQADYVLKAEQSAKTLLRIINDILDFSKIESGRLEMEKVEFSLSHILSQMTDMFAPKVRAKELAFEIIAPPSLPPRLLGDPLRLSQVLLNLVSNAVKFTEKGEILLSVSEVDRRDRQVTLQFTVQDTGIGLTQEQIKGLFSPFTQADSSTTRKYGGTGLGLAICQKLVQLMQGEIWCSSEPGRGSAFHLTAKFELALEETNPSSSRPDPEEETAAEEFEDLESTKPILLAEDNDFNQIIVLKLLGKKGFKVEVAGNGQEAINMLLAGDYGLVLMDIQMPVMDGISATLEIRKIERFKDLPIIAMTAHAMSGDREKSLEAGMNDHLTKPIEVKMLYATLRKWLRAGGK